MEHPLLTARLAISEVLSDRTKHLEFEVEGQPQFNFIPGQFISVREPRSDGKVITRAYSLASAPGCNNRFDLCLNRVDEGFMSNYLCDLELGREVHFHGPHGHFVLKHERKDALFIATGTGIAPFRGMIHWLLADESRHQGKEYWLVYGTRYEKDIYYRDEFAQLAREHPNFHYIITLSRPSESWQGARGYVQEHVREIVGDRRDMEAYICGLNNMVSANRQQLKELGWDRHQIIYERYD
ncbi:MAG: FAD-binding oxidoreductase [Terriglobia bacterium]|nr:FAD-binding oxidoreductase [Terriglobia bacterium]